MTPLHALHDKQQHAPVIKLVPATSLLWAPYTLEITITTDQFEQYALPTQSIAQEPEMKKTRLRLFLKYKLSKNDKNREFWVQFIWRK